MLSPVSPRTDCICFLLLWSILLTFSDLLSIRSFLIQFFIIQSWIFFLDLLLITVCEIEGVANLAFIFLLGTELHYVMIVWERGQRGLTDNCKVSASTLRASSQKLVTVISVLERVLLPLELLSAKRCRILSRGQARLFSLLHVWDEVALFSTAHRWRRHAVVLYVTSFEAVLKDIFFLTISL